MTNYFITGRPWRRKRREVLDQFHHECQRCKSKGRYTRATVVHHDRARKEFPELALSDTWTDSLGHVHQNLIPLCFDCHEAIETERGNRPTLRIDEMLTEERW